jgi:hypothetical protein
MPETIASAGMRLARGEVSSRALVDEALQRASYPNGEGARVFRLVDTATARRTADGIDLLQSARVGLSPLAGLPVSVKDLFDVQGQVTTAASPRLRSATPAGCDSTVVARLKRAGAVIAGRTNMTEFAFSGVGINPHFGTPANPYQRERRRIPGGSSSGAAVSVTDGMAYAAICSDTGGSARIPAALCGITGFKPTQRRIPLDGVFPLLRLFCLWVQLLLHPCHVANRAGSKGKRKTSKIVCRYGVGPRNATICALFSACPARGAAPLSKPARERQDCASAIGTRRAETGPESCDGTGSVRSMRARPGSPGRRQHLQIPLEFICHDIVREPC